MQSSETAKSGGKRDRERLKEKIRNSQKTSVPCTVLAGGKPKLEKSYGIGWQTSAKPGQKRCAAPVLIPNKKGMVFSGVGRVF